ncbi:uncharacterized protein BX663DRAFT_417228, partial [Cokeromyces recurvatus]|uniref:uncharacterized protein n=1 Tax=Cokeromyces recurvatus TaxID=90255 RepID=UPI00221EC78B
MTDTITNSKEIKQTEADDMLDKATPRFESLSVSDDPNFSSTNNSNLNQLKRKRVLIGEDVFTRDCVKTWQGSRIKAWENRFLSPEGYYYRFVLPGEGQQNGAWSAAEHRLFMNRYNEWMEKGYKIGASWGLFSKTIPHRVGYQCMNYYRKLVSEGKLKDDSYEIVDGKLKQTNKGFAPGTIIPTTELGPEWKQEEIRQQEREVDGWLKEFHGRSGQALTSRPITQPKPKAAPRVIRNTSRKSNISDLVKKMPPRSSSD